MSLSAGMGRQRIPSCRDAQVPSVLVQTHQELPLSGFTGRDDRAGLQQGLFGLSLPFLSKR